MIIQPNMRLLLLCLCFITSAFTRDNASMLRNTIQVTAEGKYEAEPDTALLEFTISVQEQTYKEAHERAYRSTQQIAELLKKYNLDPKQAEFSLFQTQPVYDYNNPKRPLVGYRVHSSVSIKFTDFSKLSFILPDLMKTNIADNQSLLYILENTDAAKKKAIEDGYKRARFLAHALAQSEHKTIDEMIYASIDTFENRPQFRSIMTKEKSATAMESPNEIFGAQKITITAQINAIFEMRAETE